MLGVHMQAYWYLFNSNRFVKKFTLQTILKQQKGQKTLRGLTNCKAISASKAASNNCTKIIEARNETPLNDNCLSATDAHNSRALAPERQWISEMHLQQAGKGVGVALRQANANTLYIAVCMHVCVCVQVSHDRAAKASMSDKMKSINCMQIKRQQRCYFHQATATRCYLGGSRRQCSTPAFEQFARERQSNSRSAN